MRRARVTLVVATIGAVALGVAVGGQHGQPAAPMRVEKVKEDLYISFEDLSIVVPLMGATVDMPTMGSCTRPGMLPFA